MNCGFYMALEERDGELVPVVRYNGGPNDEDGNYDRSDEDCEEEIEEEVGAAS